MLKAFQIRAARSVTGIGVRDIGLYLKVSRTIISRWEQQMPLSEIKSNATAAIPNIPWKPLIKGC